jgi:hypothetical protein
MLLQERSIGHETQVFDTVMILNDQVWVGSLWGTYTIQAFLRGFKVLYAGREDHHVKYLDVDIQAHALSDSGYALVTARVLMQEDAGYISGGDARMSFKIDYTLFIV